MVEQAAAIADRLLEIGEQEFEWIKQGRGDPTRAQELLALARQAELLVSEPPALGPGGSSEHVVALAMATEAVHEDEDRPRIAAMADPPQHVHGPRWNGPMLPNTVRQVQGTVTDPLITVHMRDGSTWTWIGGRYASRKVNGCYAPLMPRPTNTRTKENAR